MKKFWKVSSLRLKAGLIITAIFVIIGFVVYYIPHINPFTFNTYEPKLGASAEHWLGTTSMGQDVVWLLIDAIGTVVGVLVGLLAGFAGGVLDRLLMIITDTFVVIPQLPILILMTSLMKGSSTVIVMALVLAMFAWAWPSRQIRSMALTIKERDFIQVAKFSGEGTLQIVVTEILPYAFTWSLSNFMNAVLSAIGSESSLAVLGPRQPGVPGQHDPVGEKLQRHLQQAVPVDRRPHRSHGDPVYRPVYADHRL